jgi:glycosyltransferase involved in cell wall biosynthesis
MFEIPSVCIMIPTYNQANFVVKAVESALAQDYLNLEIVIADDNSTDNTEKILQPFIDNPKIKYKKNATNLGRVANYKKCLADYAASDWVINLDGDDYYTNPQFISQAMEAIQNAGSEKILFYQGSHIYKNGQREDVHMPRISETELLLGATEYFFGYFKYRHFSHMSVLYNRKLAIDSGFYESPILSSDIQSILQFCLNNLHQKVIISKNISGVWLHHSSNRSNTLNIKAHWKNFMAYKDLYRKARGKGFNAASCFIWLMKAGLIYLRTYAGIFMRKLLK